MLAPAVPVKVGVVSLVMLSVERGARVARRRQSGVPGAAGAVVSMVIDRPEEAEEVLPAASVAVAVIVWLPSAIAEPGVKLQLPEPSAVVVPIELPSDSTVTVALASAVPVKVGVVSLVMLSVEDEPVSLADAGPACSAPGAPSCRCVIDSAAEAAPRCCRRVGLRRGDAVRAGGDRRAAA